MSIVNRFLKILTFLVILIIVIGIIAAVWVTYSYIPAIRSEIHDDVNKAVARWFPLAEDGSYTFDIDIDLSPKRCRLTNLMVKGGKGKVLEDIEFRAYSLNAAVVELDMDALLASRPASIIGMEEVEFQGDIYKEGLNTYFTPEESGVSNTEWDYDDFTEKVIMKFDIAELNLGRITVTGKLEKKGDNELVIAERKYRHIHGPVAPEVASFIEDHTDLTMRFSLQGYDLVILDRKFNKDKSLRIKLGR